VKTLTHGEIAAALAPRVEATFADAEYVLIAQRWFLRRFLPWWRNHKQEAGIRYRPGVWDCDDFARHFRSQLVLAARHLEGPAAVCAAVLTVRNLTTSLHIPAGAHALNLIGLLDENDQPRWLVTEPQNGLHCDLAHYDTADQLRAEF
jgi:hypothetical protein